MRQFLKKTRFSALKLAIEGRELINRALKMSQYINISSIDIGRGITMARHLGNPIGTMPELPALSALSLIAGHPIPFYQGPENSGEASSLF